MDTTSVVMHHCSWLVVFFFVSISQSVRAVSAMSWSEWYNSDTPADGNDVEILEKLRQTSEPYCSNGSAKVQCRVANSITLFSDVAAVANNVLSLPCNLTGIVCLGHDQAPGVRCHDYEIRYSCEAFDQMQSAISSDGGFIALIAVLSVLSPILGIMTFQLIRVRRHRQRRVKLSGNVGQPPPSYDEVVREHPELDRNRTAVRECVQMELPEISGASALRYSETGAPRVVDQYCVTIRKAVTDTPSVQGLDRESESASKTPESPPSYAEALEILKFQSAV